MKRCLMSVCFATLVVSAALAQQKKAVPPPPKPADEGPSLEVTMKFIQDKLNDIGPVNYVVYYHDNVAGTDWTNKFRVQVTNAVADASACRVSYHWKVERDGVVATDMDIWYVLRAVGAIVVMPMEQYQKEGNTAAGHPEYSCKVDPPTSWLQARRTDVKGSDDLAFSDEQMANRVAKAMLRAVELCGGGAKPEPF
jgi:hypothetical protein